VLKDWFPVSEVPFSALKVRFFVTEFSFNSDFKLKEDFCLQASVAFHIQFIAFCCLDNSCILKHNFNPKKLLISHMNNCKLLSWLKMVLLEKCKIILMFAILCLKCSSTFFKSLTNLT
jgi:hypothetical protein